MFYAMQYKKAIELMQQHDLATRLQYGDTGTLMSVHAIKGTQAVVPTGTGTNTMMLLNHPELPDSAMRYVVAQTFRILTLTPIKQLERMLPYIHIRDEIPTVVVLQDEFAVHTNYIDNTVMYEELEGALRCLSLTWEGLLEGINRDVQTIQVDPYDITLVKPGKYNILGSTAMFFAGNDPEVLHHAFIQTHSLKSVKQMEHELKGYIQLNMWENGHYDFVADVTHTGNNFTVTLVGK